MKTEEATVTVKTRMKGSERREVILDAATRAFAEGGFTGTTTDAVAREAGVSQPYVVRMFGTKLELFVAVFERACERVRAMFEQVIEAGFDATSEVDRKRLGAAYAELIHDEDLLRVMMHGFSDGGVPQIGAAGREQMGWIFVTLRRTGWPDEAVRDFIAHGMLLNVLLSIRSLDDRDDLGPLDALVRCSLPE
ncbi:MAG: TetR/AcrR family transcriptional regulator [Intrasporangium sp.]|uniref:TetR/AcrR family transcriptional regulator n=1 Tax=Intrasporangium sp. TaxID=1925024 RepID=UPI0026497A1A|nr:TetR/AcrR family transcriptional regulator [Intrasporangium sp.]MDN5797160.1 TetR/AcrR family transcriptional regulator [Intrasporangium sp.]